jgi:hypothetical protein
MILAGAERSSRYVQSITLIKVEPIAVTSITPNIHSILSGFAHICY